MFIPAFLLQYQNNTAIVAKYYAAMSTYVHYLLGQRNAQGLLAYGLGDWCDINSRVGFAAERIKGEQQRKTDGKEGRQKERK